MASEINPIGLPGVTHKSVLTRLVQLKVEWDETAPEKLFMEDVLIDWVNKNDPEKLDAKCLKKIKASSAVLEEWLKNRIKKLGKI